MRVQFIKLILPLVPIVNWILKQSMFTLSFPKELSFSFYVKYVA